MAADLLSVPAFGDVGSSENWHVQKLFTTIDKASCSVVVLCVLGDMNGG